MKQGIELNSVHFPTESKVKIISDYSVSFIPTLLPSLCPRLTPAPQLPINFAPKMASSTRDRYASTPRPRLPFLPPHRSSANSRIASSSFESTPVHSSPQSRFRLSPL